jgi:hypothetical protein
MAAGHPRTRHTDTSEAASRGEATICPAPNTLPPVASEIALDLREWARRVDAAVDELYVQLERIPQLIEEGGGNDGADRSPEGIRRSAQRGE